MQPVESAEDKAKRELLSNLFDDDEVEYLKKQVDPVYTMSNRIVLALSTRHRAGGLAVPGPVLARIFVDLEEGLRAFEQAKKIKEVPLPFSYVQVYALLLLAFNVVCPMAIAVFCNSVALSVVLSLVVCAAFTAMWLVGNELEDPFGTDANDLPMMLYHQHFCRKLQNVLTKNPRDQWMVASGDWIDPRTAPQLVEAFQGRRNSKGSPLAPRAQSGSNVKPLNGKAPNGMQGGDVSGGPYEQEASAGDGSRMPRLVTTTVSTSAPRRSLQSAASLLPVDTDISGSGRGGIGRFVV